MAFLLAIALAQDVDKLIRDLGADDADARDRAAADLVKIGWTCHAKLEEALKSSDDPEIRARARQVLLLVYPWFEERKLATLPKETKISEIAVSSRGSLSACVEWTNEGARVIVNDEPGPFCMSVSDLAFAPDGVAVTYTAESFEGLRELIVGDRRCEGYEDFHEIVFSPDLASWAIVAKKGGDYLVISDGRESGPFENVAGPAYGPDGKLVYASCSEGTWTLVSGDKKTAIAGVDWPLDLRFRPGESEPIMVACKDKKYFVFDKGEKRSDGYDLIEDLTFSPDGKRTAFKAHRGDVDFIVVDGEEGENFSGVTAPRFSPDGKRVAYRGHWRQKWAAVVDGKNGPDFDAVDDVAFSPDGASYAYAAMTAECRDRVIVPPNDWVLMHGEEERAKHPWIGAPSFSPDGKKLGFGAVVGDEIWWKVIDVK